MCVCVRERGRERATERQSDRATVRQRDRARVRVRVGIRVRVMPGMFELLGSNLVLGSELAIGILW